MEVVILGAGFAGINAAVNLSRKRDGQTGITLVDVNNYHLFKPMLHEVAAASVDRGHILQPIRAIVKGRGISFVRGIVRSIDTKRRSVCLCEECSCCSYPGICAAREFNLTREDVTSKKEITLTYDYLVVALGGSPNYYGIPGAREYALPFNSLQDAEKIRKRILCAFEIASRLKDPKKKELALSFAVVGAGPTGIELVSDLHDWVLGALTSEFRQVHKEDINLYLVEAGPDILPASPEKVRESARRLISGKSVKVLTDSPVKRVAKDFLETRSRRIANCTTIWTAGVRGNHALRGSQLPLDDADRVRVDDHLHAVGFHNVFAVGDCSVYKHPETSRTLPQTGQVAVQEANYLVERIHGLIHGKQKKPFHYRELGTALSTGRHQALANFLGCFRLQGALGWLAWKATYLKHLLRIRLSVRSFLDWFLDITYDREATRHKF